MEETSRSDARLSGIGNVRRWPVDQEQMRSRPCWKESQGGRGTGAQWRRRQPCSVPVALVVPPQRRAV